MTATLWRLFWLAGTGHLHSPFTDVNRPAGRRTAARCVEHPGHTPPAPGCLCGYYASTPAALRPLAAGLADMTDEATAAGYTPVAAAVRLDNPVRAVHAAYSPLGAAHLAALRARGVNALVEGRDTYRGSHLTITGPVLIPEHPGAARGTARRLTRRYGVPAAAAAGDIADTVDQLARDDTHEDGRPTEQALP